MIFKKFFANKKLERESRDFIQSLESEYGFSFNDCTCNIQNLKIETKEYAAYFLSGNDPAQISAILQLAPEIAGNRSDLKELLTNPDKGVFVMEYKKDGSFCAVAPARVTSCNTLIFDKLTTYPRLLGYAEFREAHGILFQWMQHSDYTMAGMKYDEVQHLFDDMGLVVMDENSEKVRLILNDNQFNKSSREWAESVTILEDKEKGTDYER